MNISESVAEALEAYAAEWNKAEKAIRLAEQVNNEIVNPAIYELRYAGRRLVEALDALTQAGEKAALDLLRDAHFDCARARHDAIDAATAKMVSDLESARRALGVRSVLTAFPKFPELVGSLGAVRDKVAISREKRNDRDAIYQTIEQDNLSALVS